MRLLEQSLELVDFQRSKQNIYIYFLFDQTALKFQTSSAWIQIEFMYRRPILCTLHGAVDFFNVLKKYIMYL